MLPIIIYTIHASVCLALAMVLKFYRSSDIPMNSRYHHLLHIIAMIFFIQFPIDVLIGYYMNDGLAMKCINLFLLPLFSYIQLGLIQAFLVVNLHTTRRLLFYQYYSLFLFIALSFLHPILYSQYRFINDLPLSFSSYYEFCQTKTAIVTIYVTTISFIIYFFIGCRSIFLIFRTYRRSKQIVKKTDIFKDNYFITRIFIVVFILDIIDFFIWQDNYHISLPLWTVLNILTTLVALNHKQEFISLEQKGIFVQMEMNASDEQSPKNVSVESSDRLRREKAVVERSITEWVKRKDKPFMRKDITIQDIAHDTCIPIKLIQKYGYSSHGIDFEEYIEYLRHFTESK